MTLTGTKKYVGFGFGAIQAGLFLYEAYQCGNFQQLTVAEVVAPTVAAIRQTDGQFGLNIAHSSGIEQATIGPIHIENPLQEADRQRLILAIAEADEIGTAVPSVAYYVSEGAGSLHRVLAAGLRLKAATNQVRAVIYTAENNNQAAEVLEAAVMAEIPDAEKEAVHQKVRFLNTVIGKMSGVVTERAEIQAQHLIEVTAGSSRAYLVETFNRIAISPIDFHGELFERGIGVFEEKANLLPLEEAKLYGHNATHALAAYIGTIRDKRLISDVGDIPGAMAFLQGALIEESGAALIHKYGSVDPFFTVAAYQEYAHNLFKRMMNPYLRDTIERVGRDPQRKLGWDDRLIGTMRFCLAEAIHPIRYAFGTAAALAVIDRSILNDGTTVTDILLALWSGTKIEAREQAAVLALIESGLTSLKQWIAEEYPDLEVFCRSMKA